MPVTRMARVRVAVLGPAALGLIALAGAALISSPARAQTMGLATMQPGTLNHKEDTEAGIFPAGSTFFTWRISRRWAFNARHSQLKLIGDDAADGKFQDSHAEVQFRWRPNMAFGLGYSRTRIDLDVHDNDEPFLFDLECKGPEAFFRASF